MVFVNIMDLFLCLPYVSRGKSHFYPPGCGLMVTDFSKQQNFLTVFNLIIYSNCLDCFGTEVIFF